MKDIITNNPVKSGRALTALEEVLDPEIGLNIVDLWLIYQVDFDETEKMVFVSMTLTTQFCPMGESIRDQVLSVLEENFPGYNIQIHLVFDPPWSSALISENGKKFLNGEV